MADGFAGYGYTDSGGEKIAALIDMINGGGAGRAGQQFEGGGILSLIANALFSPYGSQARGAASPATAPRPTARPAGGAPSPAPSGLPSLRGPAGGPPPAATAPALRGPAGGPRPSAPAARSAPAMPTGGPGTFVPGSMPAARPTPALPSDPASRDPIGMATIPRIPMGGFLPSGVRNLPAGPDNRGPMASVEGPMLSEMLDAAPPPADSALMASEMLPPFMGGRPEMADTPRVPPTRTPAVGDMAGKTPADVARSVAPRPRPRARPMAFEQFVRSLGPAAEGVSPEILRTAYQNFLQGYEAN